MAGTELNVEVGDKRMDVVIPLDLEMEWSAEGKILDLHCTNINLLDQARARHNRLWVHGINQWFRQSNVTNTAHIEAIHIRPPVDLKSEINCYDRETLYVLTIKEDAYPNLIILVISILDGLDVE